MSTFTLTPEMIKNSVDYMPIGYKESLAKEMADKCVAPLKTAEQNKRGNKILALPRVYGENPALKAILLQNVLLSFYLGIENHADTEDVRKAYDTYASAHIFEQLSALRSNADVRTKAICIYNDYKAFERYVDIEIENRKAAENDTVARVLTAVQIMATEEMTQKLVAELKGTMDELQQKKNETVVEQRAEAIARANRAEAGNAF